MLPTTIFTVLVAVVFALPAYVDRDDASEIEMSLPAVNLDLLRYLSDNLNNFFQPIGSTTPDPRGLNFAQFVATNKCSGQAAWSCFTDIDANHDGFVSAAELADYDKSSMTRVQLMYDDYLETSFTEADNNNDGFVSYDEGEDYAENVLKVKADENWRRLFAEKDLDGDGRLDKEDRFDTIYRPVMEPVDPVIVQPSFYLLGSMDFCHRCVINGEYGAKDPNYYMDDMNEQTRICSKFHTKQYLEAVMVGRYENGEISREVLDFPGSWNSCFKFMSLLSTWYRGDYDLKFNGYTVTSPDPRQVVKKA